MNRRFLTININGRLIDFSRPKVMAILNITPDSFYKGSRFSEYEDICKRLIEIKEEGADIIDIGGCSTRPGSRPVDIEEEWRRVNLGLKAIRNIWPEAIVSIDTWRAQVAEKAIVEWNVEIINDISGGYNDPEILDVAKKYNKVYVYTHSRGTSENMYAYSTYHDVVAETLTECAKRIYELQDKGLNDIIIDPGFGFAKTAVQNHHLLDELELFTKFNLPLLAGVSRKSMIWKILDISPEESLTGTIALNAVSLEKGADILRVHDIKEARQTIDLFMAKQDKT